MKPFISLKKRNRGNGVDWRVAHTRGQVMKLRDGETKSLTQYIEKIRPACGARVEHPFHVVKNLSGHRKTRYRGIVKNESQWQVLFALANVFMTRKVIMARGLA